MAERILSPGVFSRENDLSFITPAAGEISTALVGPAAKGPVDIPTVVRSYGEYLNVFGGAFKSGSDYYEHFTTLAAEKYFEQGGGSLLVTRVSEDTFSSATATVYSGSTAWFTLSTIGQGEVMNNSGSDLATTDNALVTGSADNLRWEVTSRDAAQGTFSLVIRRGDDTEKNKIVLESYQNLSLDPKSPNYVAKVIGDQYKSVSGTSVVVNGDYPNSSKYVYVSAVDTKMPDYFDNSGAAKTEYSTAFTNFVIGSGSYHGSFDGAEGTLFRSSTAANFFESIDNTDTQGIDPATAYANAIAILANRDEYRFNVLLTPGLSKGLGANHSSAITSFISLVETRGDAIYVTDPVGYGGSTSTATAQASGMNSSYAAAYWPWVKLSSGELGKNVWAPASTVIGGVYAFTDRVGAEWFAPAGLLRGGIPTVVMAERKLSQSDRDSLYLGKVNPLATFPGSGVVAYGQKTLQTKASALDRVNVRRLLINLKNFIGDQSNNLVFEQNTIATRNRFLAAVNPYLETVVQRQGLYAYRVVMDDTNNTADVIDRNQLVGQIFIQPTKTAEYIVLDFVVQPTGATFGA